MWPVGCSADDHSFSFRGFEGAGEPAVFLYGDCLNRFDRGGARGWWGRTVSGGCPGVFSAASGGGGEGCGDDGAAAGCRR